MPLSASTLKTGLAKMTPSTSEATAIQAFADAWKSYAAEMLAGPVPAVSVDAPVAALKAAMTGMSSPGAGALAMFTGITAFWTAIVAGAATVFPPATSAVPPAGLSGLQAAITAAFVANKSGNLSLDDAAQVLATAIHATQSGGQAIFPPLPAGLGPLPIT